MGNEIISTITSPAPRRTRMQPVETIKVRIASPDTPDVARDAFGRLVEEWAALTYCCMVEAAMAAPAVNEPMHPLSDDVGRLPPVDVEE
jgi:hypothetical protein